MLKSCAVCDNPFPVDPGKYEKRKTCSGKCFGKYRSINFSGENNNTWKGGRRISEGYRLVYMPNHPRAHKSMRVVREHLLIVEKALGKYLPRSAMIHHVNENKLDNSPTNLVVCNDRAYHILLHNRLRAHKACGNPKWRKCRHCKQWDNPENLTIIENQKQGHTTYHKKCASLAEKRKRRIRKDFGTTKKKEV